CFVRPSQPSLLPLVFEVLLSATSVEGRSGGMYWLWFVYCISLCAGRQLATPGGRGAFLRWSLLLLAMAALAALLLTTSVEGRSAKMQWPRFAYCISRKAGPLLATPSGRCASRKMRGQFNAMKAANCVNCDKYEPPQP
ncbi:hypothetical protein MRX96_049038, partial [Rhipicephalus microplus]